MPAQADEELMLGVRRGDRDAFTALFQRHYARVHALCARLTGDAAAADDLAQDTFLRVLRLGSGFQARARFSTWLYRIARNVSIDHLQRVRRTAHRDASALNGRPDETVDDPRLHTLELALALLPADRREVLVLSRYHDLPYAQLAEVLGCSEGAARVRVHRALSELKQIVHDIESNDECQR